MSSVREQIMVALLAAVQTVPGITPYRSRSRAIAEEKLPSVTLMPQDNAPQELTQNPGDSGGITEHTLAVQFELRCKGNDSDADPHIVALHAALMSDRTLGGLAIDVIEGQSVWQFFDEGEELCLLTASYTVQYQTTAISLENQ